MKAFLSPFIAVVAIACTASPKPTIDSLYNVRMEALNGDVVDFDDYRGKALLIVNTASKCGFTYQYEGLEKLYKTYADQGFEVLGFPCNQFGSQEPGMPNEIATFCQMNFGVSFRMFSKIDVNGEHAAPLYRWLKSQAPGAMGSGAIKWNFTKFLVSRNGKVLKRYAPSDEPASLAGDIEAALNEKPKHR